MEEVKPAVVKKEKKPLSEERKEKIKQYQLKYKQKNKLKSKEYMNMYVSTATAIDCPCGGVFRAYSRYKHVKTQKHVQFMEAMNKLAKKQTEEEELAKANHVEPLPALIPVDLSFINVEQTGSLLKLSEKAPPSPKKPRKNASHIVIKPEMEQYVEKVKCLLEQPVVVHSEEELGPKRKRVNKAKVLKISAEMPVTTEYNVVA